MGFRNDATSTSIPHISLIDLNTVPGAQNAKLLLERPVPVMLLLILNIPPHNFDVGLADGKHSVPRLPVEIVVRITLFLDPFRRFLLHLLHDRFDRVIARQIEQDVNVIGDAVDQHGRRIEVFEDCRQVGVEVIAKYSIP